MIPVLYKYVFA